MFRAYKNILNIIWHKLKTKTLNKCELFLLLEVPLVARSKAWVCGRSPVEIVGSNPDGVMDV
jgi:hypothetical protein